LYYPHASQPNNPLIAEPLFLTKYIEKAGTGTVDILERCHAAGMKQPEFRMDAGCFILTVWRKITEIQSVSSRDPLGTKSEPSRNQVDILRKCLIDNGIAELLKIVGRTNRTKFRDQVLNPLLRDGLLEMTIPEKPNSPHQKYRITEKGRIWLARREP